MNRINFNESENEIPKCSNAWATSYGHWLILNSLFLLETHRELEERIGRKIPFDGFAMGVWFGQILLPQKQGAN